MAATTTENTNTPAPASIALPRWFVPLVLAATMLACLPALFSGRQFDDWLQFEVVRGESEFSRNQSTLAEFFTFANGDPEQTLQRIDRGLLPWWSDERLKLRFMRPISVMTHKLDQLLWPDSEALMHAHSVLWFLLTIVAAAFVYREIGATVAGVGLAIVLFALEDTHALTIAWLASRNHLIATALVLPAFLFHVRWQREQRPRWGILSIVLFLLALLSGEVALAYGALVVAWSVTQQTGTPRQRIVSVLPCLFAGAIWLITYQLLGFGAIQSGAYLNPIAHPFEFVVAVWERLPLYLAALFGTSASSFSSFADEGRRQLLWGWALGSVAFLTLLMLPALRRDRCLRFWFLAALLCLLPLCTAPPTDRVLLIATFAGQGMVARCIELAWPTLVRRIGALPRLDVQAMTPGRSMRTLAIVFVLLHLVLAPWLLPLRMAGYAELSRRMESAAISPAFDRPVEPQQVILVNPPDTFYGWHLGAIRRHHGLSTPRHMRILGIALVPLHLERVDDRTLIVRPQAPFMQRAFAGLYRVDPLTDGWQRRLSGVEVTILEASPAGEPLAVEFRFDSKLESNELLWVEWRDNQFIELELPRVSETLEIPARIGPLWFSLGTMGTVLGIEYRPML